MNVNLLGNRAFGDVIQLRLIDLPVVMLATELEEEVSILNQGPNAMTGILVGRGTFSYRHTEERSHMTMKAETEVT